MHSLPLLVALLTPNDELPVAREPVKEETHAYRWVQSDNDADQVHLYDGRTQVGTYRRQSGNYYAFDGTAWTSRPNAIPKGTPPIPPKAKPINNSGHSLQMPVPC